MSLARAIQRNMAREINQHNDNLKFRRCIRCGGKLRFIPVLGVYRCSSCRQVWARKKEE